MKFTSWEEINQIINPDLDYESQCKKLKELFGKTTMIVVSRPGINQEGNKAMVHTTIMYSDPDREFGGYSWSGYYIFYIKKNGQWERADFVALG